MYMYVRRSEAFVVLSVPIDVPRTLLHDESMPSKNFQKIASCSVQNGSNLTVPTYVQIIMFNRCADDTLQNSCRTYVSFFTRNIGSRD